MCDNGGMIVIASIRLEVEICLDGFKYLIRFQITENMMNFYDPTLGDSWVNIVVENVVENKTSSPYRSSLLFSLFSSFNDQVLLKKTP